VIRFSYETETEEEVEVHNDEKHVLMLYNDDVNTFDHVIDSLVEICGHDATQAEQCALLVHTKGKCDVKHGSIKILEKMCLRLLDNQLSAIIEK
jgi:ATP-dependent Clp protease adaptor protein ClpS